MALEFSQRIFEKFSNIKFHENPSNGSRVVPYGQTDRRIGMVIYNFAKAPKKRNREAAKKAERITQNQILKVLEYGCYLLHNFPQSFNTSCFLGPAENKIE